MSESFYKNSFEDRYMRENQVCSTACRHLAEWALAHFGDRTNGDAYKRLIHSLAVTGSDYAVDKVYNDLNSLGYMYRSEAVMRMYERFRRDAEKQLDIDQSIIAA